MGYDDIKTQKERANHAGQTAVNTGAVAALKAAAVWLPFNAYLHFGSGTPSKLYNKHFNVTAKTAFAIMPPIFIFNFFAERVASQLANPNAFAQGVDHGATRLAFWQRGANYLLDHPFQIIGGLGTCAAIGIYATTGKNEALSGSMRIMHTRVLAQATIIGTLATVMYAHDRMARHGRYLEPWEIAEQKRLEEEENE